MLVLLTIIALIDDPRDIQGGHVIPDEGYCDQPYVVRTDDGHWLCLMTTGRGVEGQPGQHIVATRSADRGRTWSPLVDIEPAEGPEASWVMPLKVPSGRVYAFYTYNSENLRLVPNTNHPNVAKRVDTLGDYVFKYSDDHGITWSNRRYVIPVRAARMDRENQTGGAVRFFWGVGKPIIAGDSAIFGFAKVGKWGLPGAMVWSQGWFLRSPNVLHERDPARIRWETLPEGDEGLRAPKGPVTDEANLVELPDGSFYAICRTIDGHPLAGTSHDCGKTWKTEYAAYEPGGRRIKHSRAACFVKRLSGDRYLLWFHNHGGEAVHQGRWDPYAGRNPAWFCAGVVKDGRMHWSQPEVLLYDDDPKTRISYPDFIEEGDRLFVTETQKTVARVHEVDPRLLAGPWKPAPPIDPPALDVPGEAQGKEVGMPEVPNLKERLGLTLAFRVRFDELTDGQVLIDTIDEAGRGLKLNTTDHATLRLTLKDGPIESTWESDAGTQAGTLRVGVWQDVAIIVDAGPRIIAYLIDGQFNDGGPLREYGWGRFPDTLGDLNGRKAVRIAPSLLGRLADLKVFTRPLKTFEAVGLSLKP